MATTPASGGELSISVEATAHADPAGAEVQQSESRSADAVRRKLKTLNKKWAGNAAGTLASIWATVVLLGGFCSLLIRVDFWFATVMVFMEGSSWCVPRTTTTHASPQRSKTSKHDTLASLKATGLAFAWLFGTMLLTVLACRIMSCLPSMRNPIPLLRFKIFIASALACLPFLQATLASYYRYLSISVAITLLMVSNEVFWGADHDDDSSSGTSEQNNNSSPETETLEKDSSSSCCGLFLQIVETILPILFFWSVMFPLPGISVSLAISFYMLFSVTAGMLIANLQIPVALLQKRKRKRNTHPASTFESFAIQSLGCTSSHELQIVGLRILDNSLQRGDSESNKKLITEIVKDAKNIITNIIGLISCYLTVEENSGGRGLQHQHHKKTMIEQMEQHHKKRTEQMEVARLCFEFVRTIAINGGKLSARFRKELSENPFFLDSLDRILNFWGWRVDDLREQVMGIVAALAVDEAARKEIGSNQSIIPNLMHEFELEPSMLTPKAPTLPTAAAAAAEGVDTAGTLTLPTAADAAEVVDTVGATTLPTAAA
ncbi:unnamed protein product [Miscanthus lutarioriparius]|uniref:Uncharacterized protein n=1 Tax=Miscanthus lutarioriparius TaxID=422564 RepID=A0A811P5Q3_9POAL|nr:unnamed protein product [Miscanthus lutarioriparius]